MIKYAFLDVADAVVAVAGAGAGAAAAVESYWSHWRLAQFLALLFTTDFNFWGKKKM